MSRPFGIIIIICLLLMTSFQTMHGAVTIKLATLAPSGSTWMNFMQEMSKELLDRSSGQIRLRLYAGGVHGDEKDMVRRMQIGQLHSGAMTSVGLSLIQKEALVFQIPLLFADYEELNYARTKMQAKMEAAFEKNGYILLGWGDVGPIYIFSKTPIKNRDDLKKVKIWGWTEDRISQAIYREAQVTPIPLAISEVLPSLQTGIIDTFPSSPLACIALQWFSKVKYMTDLPLSIGIGATVITKKQFDRLDGPSQTLLREVAADYHQRLNDRIHADNIESIEALKNNGIELVPVNESAVREWEEIAGAVRYKLIGELYSKELLDEVTRLVQEYRENR